jgi:thiol-disulfide isomerase/thioredoxin
MNEILTTVLVVVVTFIMIVGTYRLVVGYYPASKFIIEDPPIQHNGLDANQARVMFFYTTWCPYSKEAWEPWNSFKQKVKNNRSKYGGKQIIFEEINADADKGKTALYSVKEFPSFKAETIDKVYVLKAKPTVENFELFISAAAGEETSS